MVSNLKRFNYYGPEWQLIRAFGILRMPPLRVLRTLRVRRKHPKDENGCCPTRQRRHQWTITKAQNRLKR
jgi:hypothetical protein